MLVRLIKYLEPVRVAQTREEREAIYRFRYRVYHEELGREIGGVDHARKMVVEPEDEAPGVFHLYAGRLDAIRGVGRVRVWAPGQVPEPLARLLSLERVPGIERFGISELGRLMVDRRHRGARVAAALAIAGFEVQANHGVDLAFCYCRPGLVDYYRRLGARPYGADLVEAPEGLELALMAVLSDRAHYKKVRSPLAGCVKRHFGRGKRAPLDPAPFEPLFCEGSRTVVTQAEEVCRELAAAAEAAPAGFLPQLSAQGQAQLARYGFVMSVPPGAVLTRQGHVEREIYIALAGDFAVERNGQRVAALEAGEVFGEAGFLGAAGTRTATVRAERAGRVFVLRRSFLDTLTAQDPALARDLMRKLARLLSARASRW